ncbi:hypothetical protein VUR80DRAFT_4460 [Thermomyces stellatus]
MGFLGSRSKLYLACQSDELDNHTKTLVCAGGPAVTLTAADAPESLTFLVEPTEYVYFEAFGRRARGRRMTIPRAFRLGCDMSLPRLVPYQYSVRSPLVSKALVALATFHGTSRGSHNASLLYFLITLHSLKLSATRFLTAIPRPHPRPSARLKTRLLAVPRQSGFRKAPGPVR